ncbi:chromo domain protein LHP1 isoform X1 [Coffea eugenioides]|uniref:chromo domain protein LHP1 isoform X1 n=1 Tax=Coffea eugenioides TaxID=49369 RepID=UPI000F60C52B|nr:chromo domain protein LHP1 isoform X1 [Coffea eugenioides]
MKGGKRRASVDPPAPPETSAEGGEGGAMGNDQNPPRGPPSSLDAPADDGRQKQPEKGAGAGGAEKDSSVAAVAAAEAEEEEEEEEEEEGEKANGQFDEGQMEEGEGEEGEGEGEKAKLAEGYYEIEAVRRKRVRKGEVQYLIKWRGWPETANTWEPLENLLSCSDVIEAFEDSLRSGKRSTRRRKRKYGSAQSQSKKKQQQRSPAAATYNVPAVKVRILEKPLPFPPLNEPGSTNGEAGVNGVDNENGANPATFRTDLLEEPNELNLKISELRGAAVSNEDCVDKYTIDAQEAPLSEQSGRANGLQNADCPEPVQSGRCTGAKRRKSGSVKRFKQDSPSGMAENLQNIAATNGSCGMSANSGSQSSDHMANDLRFKSKVDGSKHICDITEIVKPVSYLSAAANSNGQDISVTFMAKRSDGSEVTVDNKFLKANHPVLVIVLPVSRRFPFAQLINFYEKHLRYSPA